MDFGKFFAKFKGGLKKLLYYIEWNVWYFTVFSFTVIFVIAVWVWWNCFYDPKPSQEVITSIEQSKEDFDGMKRRTEESINVLQEKLKEQEVVLEIEDQRELFWRIEDGELVSAQVDLGDDKLKASPKVIVNGEKDDAN